MYVTIREAAQLTGLSERTLRRWASAGKLKVRRGDTNRVEIDCDDLVHGQHATMWNMILDCMHEFRQRIETLEQELRTPSGIDTVTKNRLRRDLNQRQVVIRATAATSEPSDERPVEHRMAD